MKELNDDEIYVMKDTHARYIINPFKIIFPDDPRYETALTLEQVEKTLYNEQELNKLAKEKK